MSYKSVRSVTHTISYRQTRGHRAQNWVKKFWSVLTFRFSLSLEQTDGRTTESL